jgi:tetratricopeptide (TPR) repeat protein
MTTLFQQQLLAAEGYLDLGLPLDANEELEKIAPEKRDESDVLILRLEIYETLEKWELVQTVAKTLINRHPDSIDWFVSLANATRRTESIEAARSILLTAVTGQPRVAIFHYHLACYECQIGEIEVAKSRLMQAFNLDPQLRMKALDDADLETVWDSTENPTKSTPQ